MSDTNAKTALELRPLSGSFAVSRRSASDPEPGAATPASLISLASLIEMEREISRHYDRRFAVGAGVNLAQILKAQGAGLAEESA